MTGLEFAIKMELDGEKYYLEQAEKNKNNGLRSVFQMLAEEERIHAEILKNRSEGIPYELNDAFLEIKNIFKEMGDYRNMIKEVAESFDVYRMALKNEKESYDLYQKLYADAAGEEDKSLFEYLMKQEADHCKMLEDLTEMVNRPNDWVESAEFGLREDY